MKRPLSKLKKKSTLLLSRAARIILGGKRNGAFYDPTVIVDVPKTADVAKDMEIFGPVVPIIGFDTDEEAIEIANNSKFGLSSCVFSADQKRAFKVAKAMESGGVVINGASFFRCIRNAVRRLETERHRNRGRYVHIQ